MCSSRILNWGMSDPGRELLTLGAWEHGTNFSFSHYVLYKSGVCRTVEEKICSLYSHKMLNYCFKRCPNEFIHTNDTKLSIVDSELRSEIRFFCSRFDRYALAL